MGKETKTQRRIQRHKRVRARVAGTASKPRLAAFRSNKHFYVQLLDDETGTVVAHVSDIKQKSKKKGVELIQELASEIAKAAKEKHIEKVVFDRGGYKYHGSIKALADEVRKQGISL